MRATEELSFHIEAANKKLIQLGAKPITIGCLDVVSMFPNLEVVYVSKMVMEALMSSQIVNDLGLLKSVPVRAVKNGGNSKIQVSSQETRSPNTYLNNLSKLS